MSNTQVFDQFYTDAAEVDKIIKLFNNHYNFNDFDMVFEPCAGSGMISSKIPHHNVVKWDIDPKIEGVEKKDTLLQPIPKQIGEKVLTFTNPPFGRKGALAKKFIKYCDFSDVIAIILPRIFDKYNYINSFPEYFHLIDSCSVDNFLLEGESYDVRCTFQIWEKRAVKRDKIVMVDKHPDFDMIHRHLSRSDDMDIVRSEYPFAIGQVSTKIKESKDITKGSYWFIKPKDTNVRKIFDSMKFSNESFTTHRSLSKAEIIEAYIKAKDNDTF